MPAEPVKPVSQASRSAHGGTYSFWKRSARGTMKPSRPRLASSARSAATRGALSARSLRSSNDWKWASNMTAIYEAGTPSGNAGAGPLAADQDQRGPAVEIDPPFERQAAIGRDGGVGLGRQQAGQHDARAGRGEPRQRRGEALQRPQQDIGEDEIVGRALAEFCVR